MTGMIAPIGAPGIRGQGTDDELGHITCECNDRLALCGLDVSGHHACPDDNSCGCAPCLVCEDLIDWPCRFCGE